MINRNLLIRRADDDEVPVQTVERDYVLAHVLAGVAGVVDEPRLVFKGGTALRLCYFEDYRYSADLDFSLIAGIDLAGARGLVAAALDRCREAVGFPVLGLSDDPLPRIEYQGPLGRRRTIKLDLADDELVEETTWHAVTMRYDDQAACDCLVYALDEIAAEKLRCVIQRLQCRDLYDLHRLFVERELDPTFIWPSFERKARHRDIDPDLFAERFEERVPQYEDRWAAELGEHASGEPPRFDQVLREVRRALRAQLRGH